jgi:hypothetical protein
MFENLWALISTFIVFFIGALLMTKLAKAFNMKKSRSLLIYIWHTIFCFAYIIYAQKYGADALMYYARALEGALIYKFGTGAAITITTFLVQGFGLGFIGCFLFYNILGAIGLLAFDGALKQATINKTAFSGKIATLVIFLPSVSFWSSAIGKDSISFLSAGLALWAALQLNKRIWLMVLAVALMMIVRPHMAGIMVIALAMSVMFDKKASIIKRLLLGSISIVGVAIMVPFALDYAGVSDAASSEGLINYVETRQSYNTEGGGGVDIANMSLPMQLFTYAFRPIIFEARSITALAASLDNLILLYLFILGVYALIKKKSQNFIENRKFMWVYVILSWIVLAMTTANLGIAVRQKWMFTPILIYLLLSLVGSKKKNIRY